jgi:hypothetical protein
VNGWVVFPCRRFRHGVAKSMRARHSTRGGAPREPEHRHSGVLTPRAGRVLRRDQCALCGLTIIAADREVRLIERGGSRGFW